MENQQQEISPKKFKHKELRIYASTEWLANNKKRYRQVFDRYEISYVYVELSLHNKWFDRENWDVNIELKCFKVNKVAREICKVNIKKQVSKFDSVVQFREGWGNKKQGTFWKKGTYYWEAWVEGEKLASKYFYVIDTGEDFDLDFNPLVSVKSIKLYEGLFDDVIEEERTFYKVFNAQDTRYIYSEIILENVVPNLEWQCELFVRFFNGANELKGQLVKLNKVRKEDELIKISAGWGTNVKGSWRKGEYTMQLVFMNKLIAVVPFQVADYAEIGVSPIQIPYKNTSIIPDNGEQDNLSFDDLIIDLDRLIGLKKIKKQVKDHAKYLKFLKLRKEKGFEENDSINVHSVFTGNPGTGKTTVAKKMGQLYRKMGLLSRGHVHEVDRVDLIGEYIGQTAPKVKAAIEKARGGVLFIDEAYSLARSQDDTKDFGREVIEILIKEMSNGPGDLAVIVAGYPKQMEFFIDSNPGLKSRFKLFYQFDDYLPQELSAISAYACEEKEVQLAPKAKVKIDQIIVEAFRNRDKSFGNARFVFDLIDRAKVQMGLRIMDGVNPEELEKESLWMIKEEDVPNSHLKDKADKPKIPIDEGLLTEAMSELRGLIGIETVKQEIEELVSIVRFHLVNGKDVLNRFYLHTVFVGNPGTGKTTVARILAKIYKALGILERGHMIETDRQGLVAGYVGQTAIKTTEKIDEANGGVLFIDEAYSLTRLGEGGADFGNEVIQTILKRMEDNRGEFFVFAAGYPDNMEKFLKANPGLNSRFDKILRFDDYDSNQLLDIALKMISDREMKASKDAIAILKESLDYLFKTRDKYFGNARKVRQLVSDVVRHQNLRLASTKNLTDLAQKKITKEDVLKAVNNEIKDPFPKKRIGF